MKTITSKITLWAAGGLTFVALGFLGACSKSSNSGPTGPQQIGGYVSSDSVGTDALIGYWPMDGNANDKQGGLNATVTGNVTFTTGMRGQAYQGATGAYTTYTPPASFPTKLGSYTLSFWYKLPAQPDTNTTMGVFFYSGTTQQGELINEFEAPANKNLHGDSLRIHPGFWDIGDNPNYALFVPETFDTNAIGKWEFFTVSYNGGTSTYTTYQNAVATGAQTAFSPAPPTGSSNPWPGAYVPSSILYTDGTKTTPLGPLKFTDAPAANGLVIGSWPDQLFGQQAAKANFLGQLDEVRLFSRALNQHEISGLFLNGQAGR